MEILLNKLLLSVLILAERIFYVTKTPCIILNKFACINDDGHVSCLHKLVYFKTGEVVHDLLSFMAKTTQLFFIHNS